MSGIIFTLLAVLGSFAVMAGIGHLRKDDADKLATADLLMRFLDGRVSDQEWDDFISVHHRNKEIEAVRLRCGGLPEEFPPEPNDIYCNNEGSAIIREHVRHLRKSVHG